MTIFKTILKIVKTHIAAFIIYLALPIVMTMFYVTIGGSQTVSYTHLDVYKRQVS